MSVASKVLAVPVVVASLVVVHVVSVAVKNSMLQKQQVQLQKQQRLAEQKHQQLLEQQRLAEQKRLEQLRLAELKRQKLLEQKRLEEQKRKRLLALKKQQRLEKQRRQEEQKFNQKITSAVNKIDGRTSLSVKQESLQIPALNKVYDQHRIDEMLADVHALSVPFVYSNPSLSEFTMSAQGVDKKHHLVHFYLEGYAPFKVDNFMLPLYTLAKRKSYLLDEKQYSGRGDVWQTSRQAFYYPRGDCEDHSIVLADWLIEMGEDARVALGDVNGNGHAWVILFKNGKEYLLEATRKSVSRNRAYPLAKLETDYHPEYMFNRNDFWVNTGSKYTTRYSGEKWQRRSIYSTSSHSDKHTDSK